MTLKYEHLASKEFAWGVNDCFSLARHFYKDNFDIDLVDFARPQDWTANELDLIGKLYERLGFEKITEWKLKDLRPGDALCVGISSQNPNHIVIYVGDNLLVHHLYGRMSTVEPLRDFWRSSTCYILRHKDVPDLRPVYPDKDIGTLLRERYQIPPAPTA